MIVAVSPRCVIASSTSSENAVACSSAHRSIARSTFDDPGVAPDHPGEHADDGPGDDEAGQRDGERQTRGRRGVHPRAEEPPRLRDGSGAPAPIASVALSAGSACGQ